MTPPTDAPVVLVTGATGPLGRAAVAHFAGAGSRLVLSGTSAARLEALAADARLVDDRHLLVEGDLRERTAAHALIERAVARFGRVDVLLHLVGGWSGGTPVVDLGPDEVRRMLDAHLWTTLNVLAETVPGMVERGFGRVLAVSSPLAANPGPRGAAYAIAKSAEEVLVRSLARETAGTGVTANLLVVRTIATGDDPSAKATPPEDLVSVLAYLASPAAAAVTGQRIAVGGV